jgi:DNA recombination protein RmuC
MDVQFIVAALIGIALVLGGVFLLLKFFVGRTKDTESLVMLQNQIGEIARIVDTKLGESHKAVQHQFSESAKIIRDVTERLTRLDETNKQVITITDQLKNLQDILKNPKQRGVLGEYYLETVLKNVLPPGSFQMQYAFEDGEIVDAIITVKEKIIPIDSKFSLENYNRMLEADTPDVRERYEKAFAQDLKNRIDETSKYVRPREGTMDFAFMFIPSEAVYYDLLVNKVGAMQSQNRDLIKYAAGEKKVMIVSPTTFLAYLQTVLQGLKALQIEETAQEIRKQVANLERHLGSYQTYMEKLGNHIATTVNTYNSASKEFKKIDKDVMKIADSEGTGFESMELEKPKRDE